MNKTLINNALLLINGYNLQELAVHALLFATIRENITNLHTSRIFENQCSCSLVETIGQEVIKIIHALVLWI